MKRQIRKALDIALTAVGIVIVLGTVFAFGGSYMQVHLLWTVIGLLCIEAGVWGIAVKCMPTERRYSRLRDEGDRMISLIRELNSASLAFKQGLEDDSRFNSTLENMHEAVRSMASLASIEDGSSEDGSSEDGSIEDEQALDAKAAEQPESAAESEQGSQTIAKVA